METPEHYMRIRPKDEAGAAFYAPAADITHGMKPVIRTVLTEMTADTLDHDDPLMCLARNLAEFMKRAALSSNTWEKDGLMLVNTMFQGLDDQQRERFLELFFATTMDFYWHAMRLTTESPCIKPEEMEKALGMSEFIRTMPPEMRKAYMEHINSYNMCPPILNKGPLFVKVDA